MMLDANEKCLFINEKHTPAGPGTSVAILFPNKFRRGPL